MRLALLTHEPFYPPSGGGSAEAIYLVREMVRRGHAVTVFCPGFPECDKVAREFGVEFVLFRTWPMGRHTRLRNFKYLAFPYFLERLVAATARRTPFDAVVSQHAIAAVAAGRLRRSLGIPTFMNFLDYLTGFMETWPKYAAPGFLVDRLKLFELQLPGRYNADGVLTVSDTLADRFAAAGVPREKLKAIYYGYDSAAFPLRNVAEEEPPVIVMHGSFDHHHLGPIALEAIGKIHGVRPDARFRFVGTGTASLRAFCDRVASSIHGVAVECTGFVPYRDVASRLGAATVGIVPYESSTGVHCAFVAKAVEYLGLGLPVVCTRLDGIHRYFKEEPAIRFTDFDGSGFGQAVLEWLGESPARRRQLGIEASQRVARALDWRVICRQAMDFVEERVSALRL